MCPLGPETEKFVQNDGEQNHTMQTNGQQSNLLRTGFIHLEHPSSLSYLECQLLSGKSLRLKGWLPKNRGFCQ
jgi:hypothetical protein